MSDLYQMLVPHTNSTNVQIFIFGIIFSFFLFCLFPYWLPVVINNFFFFEFCPKNRLFFTIDLKTIQLQNKQQQSINQSIKLRNHCFIRFFQSVCFNFFFLEYQYLWKLCTVCFCLCVLYIYM